jgi:tight adherence protein B
MSPVVMLMLLLLLLLLGAVAVGVALFFFQRYSNPEPSLLQQRLTGLKDRQQQDDKSFQNTDQAQRVSKLYKGSVYSNEAFGQSLERFRLFRFLKLRMHQAGMLYPDKYMLRFMFIPLVLGLLLSFVAGVLAIIGALVIVGIAYLNVVLKRSKRYGKFVAQLPDALSMVTSSLRAGHSFQSAMGMVSSEMGDPIASEFSTLVRDINLGIPVKEALSRMVNRLDTLPDVRMFSTAVTIQREAGGNLAEVLEKLGYTIRERFKLKRQIAALTGQSRMTGYVLGAAPCLLLAFLSLIMYPYVQPLYEDNIGHIVLVIILVMQCIGFYVMKKIIDIRV